MIETPEIRENLRKPKRQPSSLLRSTIAGERTELARGISGGGGEGGEGKEGSWSQISFCVSEEKEGGEVIGHLPVGLYKNVVGERCRAEDGS